MGILSRAAPGMGFTFINILASYLKKISKIIFHCWRIFHKVFEWRVGILRIYSRYIRYISSWIRTRPPLKWSYVITWETKWRSMVELNFHVPYKIIFFKHIGFTIYGQDVPPDYREAGQKIMPIQMHRKLYSVRGLDRSELIGRISWLPRAPLGLIFMTGLPERY